MNNELLIKNLKSNNSEFKSNNEEKQIEEMAFIIGGSEIYDHEDYLEARQKAKALYNANYRKQEWISVEERLPEEKVNCLIHYKHAYCDNDGYWSIGVSFYDGHEFHIGLEYKVTHWMPLPQTPKMKGGE